MFSFFRVFPSLLFVEDQVPWEVGSEKAVVYRRGMGEGKETGLYRWESHCGAVSVKASANSRGALRTGCPFRVFHSWDEGPGCCTPMSVSHGMQAAISDGIWLIWGKFLQSRAIPREGEMSLRLRALSYRTSAAGGMCLSAPQRILEGTSQSLKLWHFRRGSLPWVLSFGGFHPDISSFSKLAPPQGSRALEPKAWIFPNCTFPNPSLSSLGCTGGQGTDIGEGTCAHRTVHKHPNEDLHM